MIRADFPKDQIPHGLGGYKNHRCRCEICRAANRDWQAAYRDEHPERHRASGRLLHDLERAAA